MKKVKRLRTPLIYYGGKTKIADKVIEILPPHRNYVELCGGGAAVLLGKERAKVEVYNDPGEVFHFFRVLRDPHLADQLYTALSLTPWSRQEFEEYGIDWNNPDITEVEKVRRWVVLVNQGFTHREDCTSWLISKGVNTASAWANHIDSIPHVIERLRRVIIEHMSYEYLIQTYDAEETCFFGDPPYLPASHADMGKGYVNEMPHGEHVKFLEMACATKGDFVITGFSSPLYDEALSGKDWRKLTIVRDGQIHNSSQESKKRVEVIWIKEKHNGLWTTSQSQGSTHSLLSSSHEAGQTFTQPALV